KPSNTRTTKTTTTSNNLAKSISDLKRISKQIENHSFGYKIIKIEDGTRQLTDLCPRCHTRGTPKIERKSTRDNRQRLWRNKAEAPRTERPTELWLTYTTKR